MNKIPEANFDTTTYLKVELDHMKKDMHKVQKDIETLENDMSEVKEVMSEIRHDVKSLIEKEERRTNIKDSSKVELNAVIYAVIGMGIMGVVGFYLDKIVN